MKRCGFSLIELLVVIAILSILAGILFPVFARTRDKARQTSCLSSLKQWASAAQMYLQDYDETLCGQGVEGPKDRWFGFIPWHVLLQPYVKNESLADCASLGDPRALLGRNDWVYYRSYGWNWDYLGGFYARKWIPLASINAPADTMMFADSTEGRPAWGYYALSSPDTLRRDKRIGPELLEDPSFYEGNDRFPKLEYVGRIARRHAEGANIAFCDGHVRWMRVPGPITANDTLWDLK
jgi:prepilin-type N-terminal cleavage/methylation domain-containing protein/prepilin-type processing-associated H-X9-DG protein